MKNLTKPAQMVDADGSTLFSIQASQPRTQSEIMQDWGGAHEPIVSIVCATYNHVNYIEDAILGFLAQETTFAFEIIIRDDASTDGTTEIVQYYAKKYPSIIRAVIEDENQFSKGIRSIHIWPSLIKGEFTAFCEGDDFWVTSDKLQKQVELLRKYQDAVMSVASTSKYEDVGDGSFQYVKNVGENDRILQGFEEVKTFYYHTSTYVIRSNVLIETIMKYADDNYVFSDTSLRFILIVNGPFVMLSEVVSVHRITFRGVWTSLDRFKQWRWQVAIAESLLQILTGKYSRYQGVCLFSLYYEDFRRCISSGDVMEGIKLIPKIIRYGVLYKLPSKILTCFSTKS